jgi:hypothetical protein
MSPDSIGLSPAAPAPSSRAPGKGRIPARALRQGAAALAAFALTLTGMQRVVAPGGGDLLASKLQQYQGAAARYDTVFLGSSRIYRGVVPPVFDGLLEASGVPSSSFNLGIQYPHQLELEYLTRQVLSSGRGHLERLFVEYLPLTPQVDPANAFHARAVHWHDWPATVLALERARAIDAELPGGIPLVVDPESEHSVLGELERLLPAWWTLGREHLQHWAKRELLVARRGDVVKGALGRPHGQTAEWGRLQGYLSLEEDERRMRGRGGEENSIQRRRALFLAGLADYSREVELLSREPSFFGDEEWMNAELCQVHDLAAYRTMVAACRRAGVEVCLVIMPSLSCERALEERLAQELSVPVLRYNLPREHPELYRPELRFDAGHLNQEGARVFSERLARDWLAHGGGV